MKNRFLIKKPLISEKGLQKSREGVYVFIIDKKANKIQIKKEIQRKFSVTVKRVNIVNMDRRLTKKRNRKVKVAGYKKAIVFLKEGDKIALFEEKGL